MSDSHLAADAIGYDRDTRGASGGASSPTRRFALVLLLSLLSLGLYAPVLVYGAAHRLRQLGDENIRPGRLAGLTILPIVNMIAFHLLARAGARRAEAMGRKRWSAALLSTVFAVVSLAIMIHSGFDAVNATANDRLTWGDIAVVLITCALYAVPFAVLDRRVRALPLTDNTAPRRGIWRVLLKVLAIAVCLVIWGLIGMALYLGEREISAIDGRLSNAESLMPGRIVQGRSGRYTVTVPSGRWRQLDDTEADFELTAAFENTLLSETWVVGYVTEEWDVGLDRAVQNTRNRMLQGALRIAGGERRIMLPGTLIPVSFSHYTVTRDDGQFHISFVMLVDDSSRLIEVSASTNVGPGAGMEIKQIVESLRLRQGHAQ